jgi:YegS/Rv2252/BmrU family lipid kinase
MEMMYNSRKLLFIVNVFAASKTAGKLWKETESVLISKRIPYHCHMTGLEGNAHDLAFKACRSGYRKFVAVGGDGTVHDVLNGIMEHVAGTSSDLGEYSLGVIPIGSGNDWVKSLGIEKNISKAIDVLVNGKTGKQDVVKVSILERDSLPENKAVATSYMVNVGGVGLDAKVCELVNAKKAQGKRGKMLYVSALLHNIITRIPTRIRLFADGNLVFDGSYLSVAFGVGKYSGGGMRQTPAAVLGDGLLDVTLIPDLPFYRIAVEAPKLFTGALDKVKELVLAKCRTVLILPDEGCLEPVEVDGEVIGDAPVLFEVLEQQLNVFIP